MPGCYCVGCNSGHGGRPTHCFKFPKLGSEELKALWMKNIPQQKFKMFNFRTSTLCFEHFEDKYIVKERVVFGPAGEVMAREQLQRWRLSDDAVPTCFNNKKVPKYLDVKYSPRNPPKERGSTTPTVTKKRPSSLKIEGDPLPKRQAFRLEPDSLTLPPGWTYKLEEEGDIYLRVYCIGSVNDSFVMIEKSVSVARDGSTQVFIRGKPDQTGVFLSTDDNNAFMAAVQKFHDQKLCPGAAPIHSGFSLKIAEEYLGRWFAKKCSTVVGGDNPCHECRELKYYITRVIKEKYDAAVRKKTTPAKPPKCKQYSKLKQRYSSLEAQLRRTQKRCRMKSTVIQGLERRLTTCSEEDLLEKLNKTDLPENTKLVMRNAFNVAKAKHAKGVRYERAWLLQALLLKTKSPKAYRELRASGTLPLPSESHLSSLIRGAQCDFGFSPFIFEAMKKELEKMHRRDRRGALLLDEMKIKEGLSFNKHDQTFKGFINYGDFTEDYLAQIKTKKTKQDSAAKDPVADQIADHALVFMFKSISSKWSQPIAVFASKGAAPGEILAKLLLSCIAHLEDAGAFVDAVVSDGASSNKKMWKLLGVSGNPKEVKNKVDHPMGQVDGSSENHKRQLFFMCDVPHVFKCIRNNMFSKNHVLFQGKQVSFHYYRRLYEQDSLSLLRVCPKLRPAHIRPDSFQKMVVPYATQLFSRSVADGLRYFWELGLEGFKGSQYTEDFTRTLNDIFDALNSSRYYDVLRVNDKSYKMLKEFLDLIVTKPAENTFASEQTMDSLRVTIQSVLDLCDFLSKGEDFDFIFTRRLNQDNLEKFFGVIRSCAGDTNKPTLTSFLQLFRLLSIRTTVKTFFKGNVEQEETDGCLVDFFNTFCTLRKEQLVSSEKRRKFVEDAILSKIIDEEAETFVHAETKEDTNFPDDGFFNSIIDVEHDHSYSKNASSKSDHQSRLLFKLCGFLAFRGNNFTNCQACLKSMATTMPDFVPVASLTAINDRGRMTYPSESLFDLIANHIDPTIENQLQAGVGMGDYVLKLIGQMGSFYSNGLGCVLEGHRPSLIAGIVGYYISIRMFFFTRIFNRETFSVAKEQKRHHKLSILATPQLTTPQVASGNHAPPRKAPKLATNILRQKKKNNIPRAGGVSSEPLLPSDSPTSTTPDVCQQKKPRNPRIRKVQIQANDRVTTPDGGSVTPQPLLSTSTPKPDSQEAVINKKPRKPRTRKVQIQNNDEGLTPPVSVQATLQPLLSASTSKPDTEEAMIPKKPRKPRTQKVHIQNYDTGLTPPVGVQVTPQPPLSTYTPIATTQEAIIPKKPRKPRTRKAQSQQNDLVSTLTGVGAVTPQPVVITNENTAFNPAMTFPKKLPKSNRKAKNQNDNNDHTTPSPRVITPQPLPSRSPPAQTTSVTPYPKRPTLPTTRNPRSPELPTNFPTTTSPSTTHPPRSFYPATKTYNAKRREP